MNKNLSPSQMIIIGILFWLISKFPIEFLLGWNIGTSIAALLELVGLILFLSGIITWIYRKFRK
ncbi:MAG: hypothetical protein ABFQ62_03720 [Patescibacteria group bacterium]